MPNSDMESPPSQPATVTLEYLEGKDSGLFRMLKAEAESLKEMAKRTQVKGLKESVDQVINIIGSIESNNAEMRVMRSQAVGSKVMVVDAKKVVTILTQNLSAVVNESNKTVLDAISRVGTRTSGGNEAGEYDRPGGTDSAEVKAAVANLQTLLEAQSAKMDEMAERGKQTAWTDVVRSKGKKDKGDKTDVQLTERVPSRRRGARPPAILVDVSNEDFPELAKKIRSGACRDVIGNRVVGMRQAKSGGLLIEVRGNPEEVSAVRAEIARSAGAEIGVRTLQQRELVEIRDLDQWSDGPEVLEAITSATGCDPSTIRLVRMRKRFGGAQLALVSAPKEVTQVIVSQGRLRVGMVSCSVRHCDAKVRCFKCLAYGHEAKSCQGPDRTECCRRCGETGHKAANCSATDQAANVFAEVLQASKSMPSAGSYRSSGATEDKCTPK
ncbi:unnamed protein product [Macrosiphum euphorbiae]|uniref:CCHC-type domain-containing protein n=2 Tax=Macrosiphum euphorbiae TaxID=13131 RepID=A0AAV0Y5E3_9HEMI|nr:unnamed protein product [Macrosiphum euphorbiae]CAI6375937.1 unnamed protein product [Macrosiphum euphorbiae]